MPARAIPADANNTNKISSFQLKSHSQPIRPMKTSDSFSLPSVPSLFQIAAFFEDFFPSGGFRPTVVPAKHLPVAQYMLNQEKLMNLLTSSRTENHAAVAAAPEKSQAPAKRPTRTTTSKKPSSPPGDKMDGGSTKVLKKVEFKLKSPTAKSVKLAGEFTSWEKSPVEMMSSKDGVWFTVVPLEPGSYSYRFIVDGQWCDDPGSAQQVPNPFGTQNAVVRVT